MYNGSTWFLPWIGRYFRTRDWIDRQIRMIFESARLVARRFGPRDLAAFVAMRHDPEVARFQSWESCSEADGRAAPCRDGGPQSGRTRLVPVCAWRRRHRASSSETAGSAFSSHDHRLAQIGYTISQACWNRGFASEAVGALTAYAFAAFPIHRITASVDPRNVASCRVLEKSRFCEGSAISARANGSRANGRMT